jgi:hypothetical protein
MPSMGDKMHIPPGPPISCGSERLSSDLGARTFLLSALRLSHGLSTPDWVILSSLAGRSSMGNPHQRPRVQLVSSACTPQHSTPCHGVIAPKLLPLKSWRIFQHSVSLNRGVQRIGTAHGAVVSLLCHFQPFSFATARNAFRWCCRNTQHEPLFWLSYRR